MGNMKLYNQTRELLKGTDPWRKYEWALGLLALISGCFCVTVAPFVRKDFGERYLGWLNLYIGYSALGLFILAGSLAGSFIPHYRPTQMMTYLVVGFIGTSLWHRREISTKNNNGVEWHSMYMGTSILPLPLSEEKVYKFAEPGLIFLTGYLFSNASGLFGLWLMIAGLSLFINNHITYYNERQMILDTRDASIEAKYLSDALSGKPAYQTAGFVIGESSIKLIGKDVRLQEAFFNLSTELKDLMDSPLDLKSGATE
jgi:hypothetical protein